MQRRKLLKSFAISSTASIGASLLSPQIFAASDPVPDASITSYEDMDITVPELARSIRLMTTTAPDSAAYLNEFQRKELSASGESVQTYLQKMDNFEEAHDADIFLSVDQYPTLISTFQRLDRVQKLVGHGNFNVLSFDEMLKYSINYPRVGKFTRIELAFMEQIFSANVHEYGFFGEKVNNRLTSVVARKDRVRMPRTGNFLYRGKPEQLFHKVKSEVGTGLILTSGIRNVVKQTHLFLAKTIQSKGNLSRASRSLAPPGHSYHAIGDFDVGKVGFGGQNFTSAFAKTEEFRKLVDLGYVSMRYPRHNMLGVRYEPWHIKVV